MEKFYTVHPQKIFEGDPNGIVPYLKDNRPPYELYKYKVEKGTVYVLVKAPSAKETNNTETTIEFFDLGAPLGIRSLHLVIKLPSNGIKKIEEQVMFGTEYAIPKPKLFSLLWQSSPFNFIKSFNWIQDKIIADGFIHQKQDIFESELKKSTMKVEDFMKMCQPFLK